MKTKPLTLPPVSRIGLVLVVAQFIAAVAKAQCIDNEEFQLIPHDRQITDGFGANVSLHDDVALVGAPGQSGTGGSEQGAAYVFRRVGGQWQEEQKLVTNGKAFDHFGISVSVRATDALVGAPGDDVGGSDRGAAYVFHYDGAQWASPFVLTATGGSASDQFGESVSIDGTWALIGARGRDVSGKNNQGSAFIFQFDGSTWKQHQELIAVGGAAGDQFGLDVSLNGNVAVIGAPGTKIGGQKKQGAAYVFRFNVATSSWDQEAMLVASNGTAFDLFGSGVAVQGDNAVVGAPEHDVGANPDQGSAYVFHLNGTWTQKAELQAADAPTYFGWKVALDGDRAVIGAPEDSSYGVTDQGSAYAFRSDGTQWRPTAKLVVANPGGIDGLGNGVSLSGTRVLLGAPNESGLGPGGGAYVFELTELTLDAEPNSAPPGAKLTFTTCGGFPGKLVLLFVVQVNLISVFIRVANGSFDAQGEWTIVGNVPPGLSGYELEFLSIGYFNSSKVGLSNEETVNFQ